MMNKVTSSSDHASGSFPQPALAIAAIPVQLWEQPYEPCQALKQGTIFPSLDMPFFATDHKLGGGGRG